MLKKICFLQSLFLLFLLNYSTAQPLVQTIRGVITDKVTNTPLPGANVVIVNSNPFLGAPSDPDGNFKIINVPVGKHTLKISYLGYKEVSLSNVIVNSGKEVVLNVIMEEDFIQGKEVV